MSKEKVAEAGLGLEDAQEKVEKTKRVRKVQTTEDRETLIAGVEQMKAIGVSEKLAKLLTLVPDWNGEKEEIQLAKEACIESFGTSEELKDYVDQELQNDMMAFQGIAKSMPVLNNIKAFYGRRESTGTRKKTKTVQVNISGVTYIVSAAYRDEIADLPASEKKELLLNHPDTKQAEVIEEIL